jgi:hypothetical protein
MRIRRTLGLKCGTLGPCGNSFSTLGDVPAQGNGEPDRALCIPPLRKYNVLPKTLIPRYFCFSDW